MTSFMEQKLKPFLQAELKQLSLHEGRELERQLQETPEPIAGTIRGLLFARMHDLALAEGEHEQAFYYAKQALIYSPYNKRYHNIYAQFCGKIPLNSDYLVLVMSCHKHLDKALRFVQEFEQADITYRIIVGRAAEAREQEKFSARVAQNSNIIALDVEDSYEGLPEKVSEAIAYCYEHFGEISIFKSDDNHQIVDVAQLKRQISQCLEKQYYTGEAVGGPGHDRAWHFHKCERQALNNLPYGKPFIAPWAAGTFYYLPAKAVQYLAFNRRCFPGLCAGELYEDKLIGDQLFNAGFQLRPLSGGGWGLNLDNGFHPFSNEAD
jgi:hypothetical protein